MCDLCVQLLSVYSMGRRQQAFQSGIHTKHSAQNLTKWNTCGLFEDEYTTSLGPAGMTLRIGSAVDQGGFHTQHSSQQHGTQSPSHTF